MMITGVSILSPFEVYDCFDKDIRSDIFLIKATPHITDLKVIDNHLVRKDWFDKIKDFFWIGRAEGRNLLNNRIKQIVLSLGRLERVANNSMGKQIVRDLFINKLAHLRDRDLFSMLKVKGVDGKSALTKEIEEFLFPTLKEKRCEKQRLKQEHIDLQKAQTKNQELIKIKQREIELARVSRQAEKAKLAACLGVEMIPARGTTDTKIACALSGKKIGIFKASKNVSLMTKIKNFFKRNFHGQLYFLSSSSDCQPKAEVAAYFTDRYFDIGLSPPSILTQIMGQAGAFQSFLTNKKKETSFEEVEMVLSELESRDYFSEEELILFQKSVIFDFLIGNLDRDEKNWFIKRASGDNKGLRRIVDLKLIDNANSFIRKNPMYTNQIKNQYKWKELKISIFSFVNKIKEFVIEKLGNLDDDSKIDQYLCALEQDMPGFLEKAAKDHLIERSRVLRRVATLPNFSPKELGNIVTDQGMQAFLRNIG
ncbi:MAG: hypothetical protein P4L16_08325 [Chlamydiales bacterium]|nr:hypothetical protein [Chlamydiales bacterium]